MATNAINYNTVPTWISMGIVTGILWFMMYLCLSTAFASDYYPQHYRSSQLPPPQQRQTVIVVPPEHHRHWNPIGAIMAVPRAALAVPGAILGGDDYEENE